jgi:hypothetical protein
MTRPRRWHHISLMILCFVLFSYLRRLYPVFSWQWWALLLLLGYSCYPLFDWVSDWLYDKRATREPEDWYRLSRGDTRLL